MKTKRFLSALIAAALAITLFPSAAFAASSMKTAQRGANTGTGSDWSSLDGIILDDDYYVSATLLASGTSQNLRASHFGFSIPSGATIDGIKVSIGHKCMASGIVDNSVQLVDANGTAVGNNKAKTDIWPTAETAATYGSYNDMWGTSISASDINDDDFGVQLSVKNKRSDSADYAYVDYITITVTYNTAAPQVATGEASSITATTATVLSNVLDGYDEMLTERGFCYGTSANPTTSGSKVSVGTGGGSFFTAEITGLSPNTVYHFRAYATNYKGTGYGGDVAFTTLAETVETTYLDENGTTQTVMATVIEASDQATLISGWYVANSDVTVVDINISGDVKLILADGCTLTANGRQNEGGISVPTDNTLTIYGQSAGTGKVTATGGSEGAGIGGGYSGNGGTITINGGTVTANGGGSYGGGAGIGGGAGGSGGTITINGGTVTATGSINGAGIGGGSARGSGGIITINGGTVIATGGGGSVGGAGIGGGVWGNGGLITITGGTITATGGINGAGIGGGAYGSGGTVVITGGSVKADGSPGIQSTPTNGTANGSQSLSLAETALPGVSAVTQVISLTIPDASYYGVKDLFTNAVGKLYLWLPTGAAVLQARTADTIFNNVSGALVADADKPVIASVTPSGADAARGGNIVITFNEEMRTGAGSVSLNSASLAGGTWNSDKTIFTVSYSDLVYGTSYTVGVSVFQDYSGNEMDADATHSFTTEAAPASLPVVTTGATVSGITSFGATVTGNVASDGGAEVTERGFVYGMAANPEIGSAGVAKVAAGAGTGDFSATLTALAAGTAYHVRAYAINSEGTAYGADVAFTTLAETVETTYLDENGNTQTVTATVIEASDQATLTSGWYVANSDVTVVDINISGDVKLILADGCTLTANGNQNKAGISVPTDNTLSIYGQSAGTGKVTATGGSAGAGIGGGVGGSGGSITINGGTVTATGGSAGAGIGGGSGGSGGTITINGGTVTATGGDYSAGIGGSSSGLAPWGDGGNVIINGGTVTATGGVGGAGIGGGYRGSGGTITINGGTITATGRYGAGIGGGYEGNGGIITINGGTVTATSGGSVGGAGIGGGVWGSGGLITITGGTITATGGINGAGIGGGEGGSGGTVVITGGSVKAGGSPGIQSTPTNGSGETVYLNTLTLSGVASVIPISAGSIGGVACAQTPNAASGVYGIKDVLTDAEGKVYFYLPISSESETVNLTAGTTTYGATYQRLESGNTVTLEPLNMILIFPLFFH